MTRAGSPTEEVVLCPGAGDTQRAAAPAEAPPVLPLLDHTQANGFLSRWNDVQARFVDDPQGAVRDADSLVTELTQALAASFAAHKEGLEQSWRTGGQPGTEELRLALQQYRSFFQRLLAT